MGRHRISIFGLVSLAVASLVWAVSSTIAWFRDTVELAPDVVTGSVQGAYYAGGDGSSGNPFQIHDPIHLYNLAWLQYFGTYNKFTSNTLTSQTYFVVTADLDMTGWTLPPIGTEDCPFLGKFDGGGHTITGLTSTNEFDIGSGVKTPQKFTGFGATYHQPQIVGFFGVVGKLPDDTYTYASVNNQMINYTLNGTKVESRTSQTLIGIAAGYVNATMNGVKVTGAATIDVNGASASTAVDSTKITENLSDYGLVGYTAETGINGAYNQKLSAFYESGTSGGGSQGQNWGSSIDMRSLYDRLGRVYNSDAYDNGSFTVNTIISPDGTVSKQKVENLNNHYSGYYVGDHSYTFNKAHDGSQNFYFLYGDYSPVSGTIASNTYEEAYQNVTGTQYKLSQSSATQYRFTTTVNGTPHYVKMPTLSASSSGTVSVTDTTNINEASLFFRIDNGNSGSNRYYVEQVIKGVTTKVYLGCKKGGNLFAYSFDVNTTNNKNYTSWYAGGNNYYVVYSNKNYYMRLNNTTWQGSTTNSNRATAQELSFTNYLYASSDGACSTVTTSAEASIWYYENNVIFTIFDDKIYYLLGKGGVLTVSGKTTQSDATNWTYSNNAFTYVYNGTTYYMDFASSVTSVASKPNNIALNNVGTANLPNQRYVSTSSISSTPIPYSSFKNTYIPIATTNDIYTTHPKNSGYIISGKQYVNPNYSSNNSGDIRVSKYAMSNINVSLGQNAFSNSKLFAITATSNNDYALITDAHNAGSEAGTGLSSITARKASTSLNRYNDWDVNTGARDALGNVFTSDSENIYGLHFMDASIGTNNTVTVPGAKMGGTTYPSGLEMPKDSIDFMVNENGYITFFAGTYFSGNSSFFSLHKITRNQSTKAISAITEIRTIYKDSSNNYYYNPNSTTGLTKLFDTEVLTAPTRFINNAVYYFEIPVGPGEYALGSVSGSNGAYLMYLDISASGIVTLKDNVQSYSITTISNSNAYPIGVDFMPIAVDGSGGETIAVSISSGDKGVLILSVSSNNIAVTDSSSIATYAYRNSDNYVTSSPGSGEFTCNLSGDPPNNAPGGTRVLTINLTTTSEDEYSIRVTDLLNLNGTIASSTYEIDSGSGFAPANESSVTSLSTEINLADFRSLPIAAVLTRSSGTGQFATTYDIANCSYDNQTIDVDIERDGTTISIAVTAGYIFKIGGTQYNNGSTYPAS